MRNVQPLVSPSVNWGGPRLPRSAFLLDRFSNDCIITHCTNNAILDPETCVQQQGGIFKYVAQRDEQLVRVSHLPMWSFRSGNSYFQPDVHRKLETHWDRIWRQWLSVYGICHVPFRERFENLVSGYVDHISLR
jgi:hypothetical protein